LPTLYPGKRLRILEPSDTYGLMTSTIAELAKRYTHAQSLKRWDGIKGYSHARITLGDAGKLAPKKFLAMTRKNLRLKVGFLTGDCQLRKHLHTIGLVDTPLCGMCEQEDKTVGHVLCECPEFSSIRDCVFGECWPIPANIKEMSPSDLSTFLG